MAYAHVTTFIDDFFFRVITMRHLGFKNVKDVIFISDTNTIAAHGMKIKDYLRGGHVELCNKSWDTVRNKYFNLISVFITTEQDHFCVGSD